MSKPSNRLGKGLNALITPREPQATAAAGPPTPTAPDPSQIRQLPIDQLTPNPRQPRTGFGDADLRELAQSIRANGLLQPVVVRTTGDQAFELVAGERRWRAAKLAGLQTIPAIVRELSDAQSLELALIENLQREDLDPLERAAGYQRYLESFGGTIEDLAARLSESRASISNYVRLLKLRPEICYMLGRGELGMAQARAVAGITEPHRQLAIARLAARRNLSVRQVEALARSSTTPSPTADRPQAATPDARKHHLADVERSLSKALGLRVRLYPGRRKNSGRLVISYNSLEEFDRVAERIGGKVTLE